MGDKEYFHDGSVKVPLIIADPDQECDPTRGTTDDSLIECVDLLPTFLDYAGGEIPKNILEGRSLLPKLGGDSVNWREYAISETDYSFTDFQKETGRQPLECNSYMVATKKWKYIHAPGFNPVLFDLSNDPNELNDLGLCPDHSQVRQEMFVSLAEWSLQYRQRVACTDDFTRRVGQVEKKMGILIGYWDENDTEDFDPAVLPVH